MAPTQPAIWTQYKYGRAQLNQPSQYCYLDTESKSNYHSTRPLHNLSCLSAINSMPAVTVDNRRAAPKSTVFHVKPPWLSQGNSHYGATRGCAARPRVNTPQPLGAGEGQMWNLSKCSHAATCNSIATSGLWFCAGKGDIAPKF
jgi:hypothetical protein